MEIEERYINLLGLLIHDKRTKMNGILSSLQIMQVITGYCLSYRAFMNRQNADTYIFIEDFEKGNVVFLLPFGTTYMVEEMEEMAQRHTEAIKTFFGDQFREDMIVRISEDERQEEIRKWDDLMVGLENWDRKIADEKENET